MKLLFPRNSGITCTILLFTACPEPPINLRLIGISDDSVTIEWNCPRDDGGSPVTGYVIEIKEIDSHVSLEIHLNWPLKMSYKSQAPHRAWTPSNTTLTIVCLSQVWNIVASVSSRTTSLVVKDLDVNKTYWIRVAAENEEGVGIFRELGEQVRPMRPRSESLLFSTMLLINFKNIV